MPNRRKKTPVATTTEKFTPRAKPDEGQMYAKATAMLGNRRLSTHCIDGKKRLAIIPGRFKGRKNWVEVGSILLLNIRDYQDEKADVIYVYDKDDVKFLKKKGEIDLLIEDDDNIDMVEEKEPEMEFNPDEEVDLTEL